ncbi:MAG TPA: glycine oxidase ThiO [Dongiaceae bacterium]|nr:glycine oxidase ThiO [Dongiaceae bacterium]
MKVLIRGAGVAGLTLAHELAKRGLSISIVEKRAQLAGSASWQAGGMLAPWCECESADPAVLTLGRSSADWWDAALAGHVMRNGTLVLAPARDAGELERFARRTTGHMPIDAAALAALEPDLAGRFRSGLFFAGEAHLDPRRALAALEAKLMAMGVRFSFGGAPARRPDAADIVAECTGMAAKLPALRGVRGEAIVLRTSDVALSRPVRLLHPRFPIYVVPRAEHLFMVGATMIESDAAGPITARSMMELINAAYSLHPAFGEAEVVESSVGVRPAFPDNLPRVGRSGRTVSINGLYRHGFLLAPAMAGQAVELIFGKALDKEVLHGTHR